MTYSIGSRAPSRGELAGELLQRLAEDAADAVGDGLYADPKQAATAQCGEIPDTLVAFARKALEDALRDPLALQRVLGEYLTEPKGHVSFDAEATGNVASGLVLDRRTRMAYDTQHVFINGESFLASGRDAQLMRLLADERHLNAANFKRLSAPARELVQDWLEAGWIHGNDGHG